MKHECWLSTADSEHFVYHAEAKRPWSPTEILELVEGCYREYYDMMGSGLKTFIEIEDRLCPKGKRSAMRSNGKIICEFPDGFGKTQDEQELAYHFFAHEVFHHWVGGYTVSHGDAIEALTQYMANRTLFRLGWFAHETLRQRLDRRRVRSTPLDRYYVGFSDLEKEKGEATLCKLCCELANCFRTLYPTYERADVAPILSCYIDLESHNEFSRPD